MGKIVEKKKKKKGRPSLLDLQKRNLKEQEEEHQRQLQHKRRITHNSAPPSRDNYPTATPTRRSARRNPNPGEESPEEEDDDDELAGRRREKKLKLVLRLPRNQKSSRDSGGSDSDAEEDEAAAGGGRKGKINAIADGSGVKVEKSISGANQPNSFQGATKLEPGPSTPLPDKKLLQFVLDRLQKKDTYGVFSDPVDPEELPDYHEVIDDPMDFSTVRKKLSGGSYASLEQFEKDVFLICSNAMQYNSPDTIYFRQARSIHELAKKNFDSLRQDSDNNEPEFKIVRRGRPPTKNLKKPVTESSSVVTPTSAGENHSLLPRQESRHGSLLLDKSGLADSSGRLHAVRNNYDLFSNFSADNRFERSDELAGSFMKGNMRHGKKQVVSEESRRVTYMQSSASDSIRDPSVLSTFDGERKQLMPVGVLVEHGYARSLARFAADLGPVAWKIAAAKIEKSLPAGVNFGPGWVGENDLPQRKMPLILSQLSGKLSVCRNLPDLAHSHHIEKSCSPDLKLDKSPVNAGDGNHPSDKHPLSSSTSIKSLPVSADAVPLAGTSNRSPEPVRPSPETLEGTKPHSGVRPSPAHQGPTIHPGMNGFSGFNVAAQMGNKGSHPRPNPSWQSMSQNPRPNQNSRPQQIPDSVPPDLNVRFQSPGSPTSSKVDSAQPNLALQL